MNDALAALRAALETGDVAALAPAYARNAVLDASLPGGRARHEGRDAIRAELARWWPGPGAVTEFAVDRHDRGAALHTERDGVRRRHYLRLSGDLIARHWVYAMAPRAAVGAGNSGASLEEVLLPDGSRGIAKLALAGGDWLSRATGGRGRTADLFRAGVLQRVPDAIDTATVGVDDRGRVLMRDVSAHLLPPGRRITREEHRRVFVAAAALHAEFWGERIDELAPLVARIGFSGPAVAAAEIDGSDLLPKQFPAAWEAFAEGADDDVAAAVLALLDDPAPIADRLAADGTTLMHGDLRDENLGFDGGRVVLLDWDLATAGTPAVEVAWTLCHDAWRTDATRDELIEDFLAAEDGRVDEAALDLGLITGLMTYGWIFGHSAVVHPDPAERAWARGELGWWVPRVRAALERTWAPA